MPIVIQVILVLLGSLFLVDQSQVLCSTQHCSTTLIAPTQNPSFNLALNVTRHGTPLKTDTEQSKTGAGENKSLMARAPVTGNDTDNVHSMAEGGIEGSGFIPTQDNYTPDYLDIDSSYPDPSERFNHRVGHERAIAEGGIEGTGMVKDFDEPSIPVPPNKNEQLDPDDGIEGTGIIAGAENQLIAYGPITQFGSIYVNGIKYEIDDAELEFVNGTGTSELSIGMMVQVNSDWQQQINGVFNAQKVTFDHQLEGPIKAVVHYGDATLLDILGSTVVIANDTIIDKSIIGDFKVGAVVIVSGITNEKGQLLATYIAQRSESYSEGQQIELEGYIDGINERDQILHLNSMDVDVSWAVWKKGSLQTVLLGTRVEVVGLYDAASNRIIAKKVRVKNNNLSVSKGNKLSIDTIVSRYQSINQFRLNGYITNAVTAEFLRGEPSNLANGVRVRATGWINADGIFEVHTLSISPDANFAVKVQVNAVNKAAGEISFLNLSAYTQSDTVYQSKLKSPNKYFSINDIASGDWIEIKGVEEGGRLTISQIFALRNKKQMILKGQAIKDLDGRTLLLGIEIQAIDVITPESVSSIKDGDTIVVKGTLFDGDTFYARELIVH